MRYTRAQIVDGTGFAPDQQFETVEDYNGWTNRETWAVALYINNDQGWQENILDALRENKADAESNGGSLTDYLAGEIIKDNVEETLPELGSWKQTYYIVSDIGSLWRVNWEEIGASFIETLAEES